MTKHELAEWLHDNYEQIAKAEKWQTQEITRVKFEDLPAENKSTMLALADRMLNTFNFITSNTVLADSAFFPTSSTTKIKEGYYTDNFNTYYIDSEGKKHLR